MLFILMAAPSVCEPLRVMTFNIRFGSASDGENHWDHRKELVLSTIRQCAPDLLGLQEAERPQLDVIRKGFPQYGEIGQATNGGADGEYCAILFRSERLAIEESETFWLSNTPEIPSKHWGNNCIRLCTWGRFLDRSTGQIFYAYNTHLDHRSQQAREKGVHLILHRIAADAAGLPVCLTGDFNADETNPTIRYVRAEADIAPPISLLDTFHVLHPDATDTGTYNCFEGVTSGPRIDYVFVSPGTRVLEAAIVRTHENGRYPSDHFPVTATVDFGDRDDQSAPTGPGTAELDTGTGISSKPAEGPQTH